MIYKNKEYIFFNTDFYQLAMSFVYIMDNKANEITGYEGFVRNIKSYVNPNENYYKFSGENEVHNYIENIRKELKNPILKEIFISIIEPKIKIKNWKEEFYKKFDNLIFDFEYEVVKEDSIVFPLIPVFQYRGPRWIGQIIETAITNIYNGKTGLNTIINLNENNNFLVSYNELTYLKEIVFGIESENYSSYLKDIEKKAKEYKKFAFDKILLEAAFRRAPSKDIAVKASQTALENNWNGTSNVNIINQNNFDKINGTMAHAFVLSYKTELEAFQKWNKYFPRSTILVDTYDTINAINILIDNDIKPSDIRIDSGNFFDIVPKVRYILDNNGWKDVDIFISGDITPNTLSKLNDSNIPFNKCMAGTHFVYCNNVIKKVNSGFVYKIVEYINKEGEIIYPTKKSIGKKNYPGLKKTSYINDTYEISILSKDEKLDLSKNSKFIIQSNIHFDIR